jgi:membrane associated rhomboid family serine protease
MPKGSVRALLALIVTTTWAVVTVLLTSALIEGRISVEVAAAGAGLMTGIVMAVFGFYFIERKGN